MQSTADRSSSCQDRMRSILGQSVINIVGEILPSSNHEGRHISVSYCSLSVQPTSLLSCVAGCITLDSLPETLSPGFAPAEHYREGASTRALTLAILTVSAHGFGCWMARDYYRWQRWPGCSTGPLRVAREEESCPGRCRALKQQADLALKSTRLARPRHYFTFR